VAANAPIQIGTLIELDPEVNGGRPCMAGTGTSVHAVAVFYQGGLSAEQIGSEFSHIPMSHIHAALAYYLANRAQIDSELQAEVERHDRALADGYRALAPEG
jgi:uncharacterized protein (DUF433 family)